MRLSRLLILLLILVSPICGYGEKAYFPLISGFHSKFYISNVVEPDFLFFRFDTAIDITFLVGENEVEYFKTLIELNRQDLLKEAKRRIPSRYEEIKKWPREWIISKLLYQHSRRTPKERIFLEYTGSFPMGSYNSFPGVTYYYRGDKFLYTLSPEKLTGDWSVDRKILQKSEKTIFIPLNPSKVTSWIIRSERGNLILGYVYSPDIVKIWNGKTLKEFKCLQIRIRAIRREGFKYIPPEEKFWFAPGIGLVLETYGGRFLQLIQYFRPDTEERWRYGFTKRDLMGYRFDQELEEVEKAWEEKGFKVFYQQEWPEEQTQK